jgi:hypothetical protein
VNLYAIPNAAANSINGAPTETRAVRTNRQRFLRFSRFLFNWATSSEVTGLTEYNEAPQQNRQCKVPAGLGFLQMGQINQSSLCGSGFSDSFLSKESEGIIKNC